MTLRELPKYKAATVTGFSSEDSELETRLREIGFAEGDRVTALHFGLFGRNPMSVKLNGALIALRRRDAGAIQIELAGVTSPHDR